MQALAAHYCLLSSKCRERVLCIVVAAAPVPAGAKARPDRSLQAGGPSHPDGMCVHGGLLTGRCRALVLCIVCMLRAADGTVSLHAVKAVHLKHVALCQPGAAVCVD